MRVVYVFFLGTLFWSYWKALRKLRGKRFSLTPILGWTIGLGYFLLAPLTLLVLNGGYTIPSFYEANGRYASVDLSGGTYLIPMIITWLALLFSFQGIVVFANNVDVDEGSQAPSFSERKLKRLILLTFGLSVLDHVATIWRLGGLEAFLVSHWYSRQVEMVGQLGDVYVLYAQFCLANQILFTAAAALYTALQLQQRRLHWLFSGVIAFGMLLQMVMSGNRIFIALYGLSFLASCWVYGRKRLIAAVLVVSPVLLLVFSAWAYFRHDLSTITEDVPTYVEADLGNRAMTTLMDTTEGQSVMLLLHTVNDFGSKFDYFYGLSYSKAILFVVPRRWYPNKPENFPGLIGKLYEPGEVTSLGTTQLGELYANFGILSVLLLPLMTILILIFSEKLTRKIKNHALLSATLFLLLIWCTLISFEDTFITFLFALLIIRGLRLERGLCLPSDRNLVPSVATP